MRMWVRLVLVCLIASIVTAMPVTVTAQKSSDPQVFELEPAVSHGQCFPRDVAMDEGQ